MKSLIDEKTEYQQYFIARLSDVGYRERIAKEKYDKRYAMDTEELLAFLRDTQPEEMATLEKIHKDNTDEMVVAKINQQILQSSLLDVLKDGVEITGTTLKLIYNKPATSYNPTLEALYKKNRFT
ncbi:type I restriction endonuclease subunit R, partial [Candidatus Saccharibacteria bacterium]|nr:type I restriction endonuclease subunit R [Candidatus Saccharibacteria bacterium]